MAKTQVAKKYGRMFREYPDAVSVKELQRMLGIGKNLAYELVNNNAIPHVKVGRKVIIAKVSVIDYLAGQSC